MFPVGQLVNATIAHFTGIQVQRNSQGSLIFNSLTSYQKSLSVHFSFQMGCFLPFLLGTAHQVGGIQSGVFEFDENIISDGSQPSSSHPKFISRLLCLTAIPSYMIPGEILHFFSSAFGNILSIRIYSHYANPEKYLAALLLDTEESAQRLMEDYDGQLMSSLDSRTYCNLYSVVDVKLTSTSETSGDNFADLNILMSDLQLCKLRNTPPSTGTGVNLTCSSIEHGNEEDEHCPVCLEAIVAACPLSFTTCCRHKFHIQCVARLEGPQCPVCRFVVFIFYMGKFNCAECMQVSARLVAGERL